MMKEHLADLADADDETVVHDLMCRGYGEWGPARAQS
jgi:hypothetical protein